MRLTNFNKMKVFGTLALIWFPNNFPVFFPFCAWELIPILFVNQSQVSGC